MRVVGGILTGGSSRRMGRPKHLIEHRGKSFTRSVADALRPHCDDLVVLGDVTLPDDATDLATLPDREGARGPIAGIAAALASDPEATWVVVACDMPMVDSNTVGWLLNEHRRAAKAATLPWVDDRPLPTCAVYGPAIRPAVEHLAEAGRGPISLGHRDDVHTVTPPHPERLCNVNTPEELEAILLDDPSATSR